MSVENLLLIALVALTLFNNGVQAYIHFEAYPLFSYVGKAEFATYIQEYERRLTFPLLVPYGLTLLSNLALIFLRPEAVPLVGVIVVLFFNLIVAVVTMGVATPVYNSIKAAGQATGPEMTRLMGINLVRLILSTVASFTALYLLANVLG